MAVERLGPRLWRAEGRDGARYLIRPLTPDDAEALVRAYALQDPDDRLSRMLAALPRLPLPLARRLCTVDPARDLALVLTPEAAAVGALGATPPGDLVAGARLMRDRPREGPDAGPDDRAEFAVSVASRLQGQGLGRIALETVLEAAPEIGVRRVWGSILRSNAPMRGLARRLGMTERPDPDDPALVIAERDLAAT